MNQYIPVNQEISQPLINTRRPLTKKLCRAVIVAAVFCSLIHGICFLSSAYGMLERIRSEPVDLYIAPRRTNTSSSAYAIVSIFIVNGFDNRRYLEGLCKLKAAIDRYASIDKVLLILGAYEDNNTCGWIPRVVDAIEGPRDKDPNANKYLTTKIYTKLRIWELVQYDALLYIDLDTLIIGQFSQLFETHLPLMLKRGQALGMGHNTFPDGPDFNSGVILLVPNLTLFDSLHRGVDLIPHDIETGDQTYLNAYFQDDIYLLPFRYNSMVSVKTAHPDFWAASEHSILHYTCKPWNEFNCWRDGIEDLCMLWHVFP